MAFMGRILKLNDDGTAIAMEGDGTQKECLLAVGQGGVIVARAISEFTQGAENPLRGREGGPTGDGVSPQVQSADVGRDAIPGSDVDAVPVQTADALPPSQVPADAPKPQRQRRAR